MIALCRVSLSFIPDLSSLNIIEDDILKIVRALNSNKAHGHDEISVRMIKICD